MTTPDRVTVSDYWDDFGTVETGTAKRRDAPRQAVVCVSATGLQGDPLDFTPAQAREFAAAINAAADAIDPDGARPPAVVDNDGDVWHLQADGFYHFDGMREDLAAIRDAYGPIQEIRP